MNLIEKLQSQPTIIFEGITGCGKSTIINEFIKGSDKHIYLADSTALAYEASKDYRDYLRTTNNEPLAGSHIHQSTNMLKIDYHGRPDLLFIDRFLLSNLVYTIIDSESNKLPINREQARAHILSPLGLDPLENTLTIYLDIDPGTAEERTASRLQKDHYGATRNTFNRNMQLQARNIYLEELAEYRGNKAIIDANNSIDQICTTVQTAIETYIGGWHHAHTT